MEQSLKLIEKICGLKPDNQELIIVGNDPNYVFVNDPKFNSIRLFDIDGNMVDVNSWIECANYVNGGWTSTYTDTVSGNLLFLIIVLLISTSYILLRKTKFNKFNYEK